MNKLNDMPKIAAVMLVAAMLLSQGCAGKKQHITYECVRDSYQLPEFDLKDNTLNGVSNFEQQCLSELIICAAE